MGGAARHACAFITGVVMAPRGDRVLGMCVAFPRGPSEGRRRQKPNCGKFVLCCGGRRWRKSRGGGFTPPDAELGEQPSKGAKSWLD